MKSSDSILRLHLVWFDVPKNKLFTTLANIFCSTCLGIMFISLITVRKYLSFSCLAALGKLGMESELKVCYEVDSLHSEGIYVLFCQRYGFCLLILLIGF